MGVLDLVPFIGALMKRISVSFARATELIWGASKASVALVGRSSERLASRRTSLAGLFRT